MSTGPIRWTVLLAVSAFFGPFVTSVLAQDAGPSHNPLPADSPPTGRDLFLANCANCHGADGTGSAATRVGLPIVPPDFTESRFASREPQADWAGIVTLGGPLRGFDRLMPSFGDALTREEIDLILEYVQTPLVIGQLVKFFLFKGFRARKTGTRTQVAATRMPSFWKILRVSLTIFISSWL